MFRKPRPPYLEGGRHGFVSAGSGLLHAMFGGGVVSVPDRAGQFGPWHVVVSTAGLPPLGTFDGFLEEILSEWLNGWQRARVLAKQGLLLSFMDHGLTTRRLLLRPVHRIDLGQKFSVPQRDGDTTRER